MMKLIKQKLKQKKYQKIINYKKLNDKKKDSQILK